MVRRIVHRVVVILAALGFLVPFVAHSQVGDPVDVSLSQTTREATDAVVTVAEMLISDSFSPMTGYEPGNLSFIASSALFEIDQAHEAPLVEGKELRGWSIGAGAGYAFADRWLGYAIATGMSVHGTLSFQPYEAVSTVVDVATDYGLLGLNVGLGYELFSTEWFSMPLFLGPHLQYYATTLVAEEITITVDSASVRVAADIDGAGFLWGVSGGAAAHIELFDRWAFTPYVLGLMNVNGPTMDAGVTTTLDFPFAPVSQTVPAEYTTEPLYGIMAGLDVGFRGPGGWKVSLALGDVFAYLTGAGNTMVQEGVVMRPLIVIVSYQR